MSSVHGFITQLATAEADLVRAETALDAALREIVVLPRAQKTAVSAAVEAAFAALRAARSRVTTLREQAQ